ncbi:uncharacterized protein LOC134819432 [Bolinopsis microptera]|uniref:uncharacterized protein LOC134819432 n=1 Tax=Bolinopsis microptera TaxID=2820187 RepID=UPI00307A86B1
MFYLLLLLVVPAGATRLYTGRNQQHETFNSKLDQLLKHIDSVGSELKTLNTAYKNLKEQGDQYRGVTDGSHERGQLAPLLSAMGKTQPWDENVDQCTWTDSSVSKEMYHGGAIITKKYFCSDSNHFLTHLEYSDELGIHNGKCCKRRKR